MKGEIGFVWKIHRQNRIPCMKHETLYKYSSNKIIRIKIKTPLIGVQRLKCVWGKKLFWLNLLETQHNKTKRFKYFGYWNWENERSNISWIASRTDTRFELQLVNKYLCNVISVNECWTFFDELKNDGLALIKPRNL